MISSIPCHTGTEAAEFDLASQTQALAAMRADVANYQKQKKCCPQFHISFVSRALLHRNSSKRDI
jgi:hypothetical protein